MSIIKNTEELNNLLDAVQKLPVKKDEQEKVVDITENGTTVVTPDEGMTLGEVTVNVAIESGGGEDDFIGIKYSNYSGEWINLPKTADARSLDLILKDPPHNTADAENGKCLSYAFYNQTPSAGYFLQLEEIYFPKKVTVLNETCTNCIKLKNVYGDLSNITEIARAFYGCISLTEMPYMPNLRYLGHQSFVNCTGLAKVTLPNTIVSIANNAFNGCTNLKDIYVPWAEGAIANAPWGATNATIHYNSEV
jgi:hypothetical protein